jgi:hypothetical protein
MKTQIQQFEEKMSEATAIGIDTDKVFENIKGKFVTHKTRIDMLDKAISTQKQLLADEATKPDMPSPMPCGKVEVVSNTAEGRNKCLSDFKKSINKKGDN